EGYEGLAVAPRTAHVRLEHRDAELVDIVVPAADEAGPRLRFRPAVNLDQHRPAARESFRRPHDEAGDLALIEAFPGDRLRRAERGGFKAFDFRLGPARDLASGEIEHVDVARALRRVQVERQDAGI